MNILIIEDEIPAFKKLLAYLRQSLDSDFEYTHTRSVEDTLQKVKESDYDLIVSDIKIIGGTSFDVFQKVKISTPIIFCTAYDEHLLMAFQGNGIAYVLKPYSQTDIDQALQKHKTLFPSSLPKDTAIFQQFKALIEEKEQYKKRFVIKKTSGIQLINTNDVSYIQAMGDFCKLKDTSGNLHSISTPIGIVVKQLNPDHFFRINRSYIVHINCIEKIVPYSKNRLSLMVKGMPDSILTSTSTTKAFRQWIDR